MVKYKLTDTKEEIHLGDVIYISINGLYKHTTVTEELLGTLIKQGFVYEERDFENVENAIGNVIMDIAEDMGLNYADSIETLSEIAHINAWAAAIIILKKLSDKWNEGKVAGKYLYAISPQSLKVKEICRTSSLNYKSYPWFISRIQAEKALKVLQSLIPFSRII